MKILIFGAGDNHLPLLISSNKKKNFNIVLHKDNNDIAKKLSNFFFKVSVYNKNKVIKICKLIKKKKVIIDDIICRSTGPSILSAAEVCKRFKINRVSDNLARCIYSKSFFIKELKKNKIPHFEIKKVSKITNKIFKDKWVLKPDAPLVGKKYIYLFQDSKISKKKFQIAKKMSHNTKVCLTKYIPGNDVNIIFFIEKKTKKINLLNIINEWNFFKENEINNENINSVAGVSTPEVFVSPLEKKLMLKYSYKILKMFSNYYGFFNIAFRVHEDKVTPYEININIETIYAKKIFPLFFNKKSSYDLEVLNLMSQKIKLNKTKEKIFFGYFDKKTFRKKRIFIKRLIRTSKL